MRKLLLIDDQDDVRAVVSLSLELTAGWRVLTASSGSAGIRIAVEAQPEAILMDVTMPEMDGLTAFLAMQNIPQIAHIPVILLTASTKPWGMQRLAELGVSALIRKPFDPLTLAHQIAGVLHWRHVPAFPHASAA